MFWSYSHFLVILLCPGRYDESSGKNKCSLYYCDKSHVYLYLCLREKKKICQAAVLPLSVCFISVVRKMLLYRENYENSVLERKKVWRISFNFFIESICHLVLRRRQLKTILLCISVVFCFCGFLLVFFKRDYTLDE